MVLLGDGHGNFEIKPPIVLDGVTNIGSLVAGDFLNNGRDELAVFCDNSYSIENGTATGGPSIDVLVGNNDGTFQAPIVTPTTDNLIELVAADFTNNGVLDLAAVFIAGLSINAFSVSLFLGYGNGTFQSVGFIIPQTLDGVVTGDFSGDGRSDIAYDDPTLGLQVLLSNGDGGFSNASTVDLGRRESPVVADLTGDGVSDVAVLDAVGDILFRPGIPDDPGSFGPPVIVNAGDPSRDIAVVDASAGPEIASVDADNDEISLFAWRNDEFVQVGSLATGQFPAEITACELLNGASDALVISNAGDGTLSIYYPKNFDGPANSTDSDYGAPLVLPVGLGVSAVEAVDTTGDGRLDLVVTNDLTGQVSVLVSLGDGNFAAPAIYQAGSGSSLVSDITGSLTTSLEATSHIAAGPLTPGSSAGLVTANPGSNTIAVLAALGNGEFANPTTIQTPSPVQVVDLSDLTGNGVPDLAALSASGLQIYMGNGNGGFDSPTSVDIPAGSTGFTFADVTGSGKLDLLVSDAFGDVLVLPGNGDGTFRAFHEATQTVVLAVADLTGNGSKDIIYADQGLDRVVVDYGAGNSHVVASQSTGLLDPGAVALADLNNDGIDDLIVANSGSDNVLIYPGKGNGQFGPAINDGNGYFVGTNPVGITVANLTGSLPDLVVADEGSNQVAILFNASQTGGPISFSAGPRLNSGGSGPVSTVVGNFGGAFPDILVTNSQSNDVALLPGVGQGFFDDIKPRTYTVGTGPGATFVVASGGQLDLVTVNAGSNDLTLISGFNGLNPTTTTLSSGGIDPDTAFALPSGGDFEGLVVGNAGDGALDLFQVGPDGLSLTSAKTESTLLNLTDLAFSAITGGQVQFYAATEGSESAVPQFLNLVVETPATQPSVETFGANPVAQLVSFSESSLPVAATVLTLTIAVSDDEINVSTDAAFLPATGVSLGQGLVLAQGRSGPGVENGVESDEQEAGDSGAMPSVITPWEKFVIGLDQALEQFQREHPNGIAGAQARDPAGDGLASPAPAGAPAHGEPTRPEYAPNPLPGDVELDPEAKSSNKRGVEAIDAVIHSAWGDEGASKSREGHFRWWRLTGFSIEARPPIPLFRSSSGLWCSHDRTSSEARTSSKAWLSPSLERYLAGPNQLTPAVRAPGNAIDNNDPDPLLMSLACATIATEWARTCRRHRHVPGPWPAELGNPVSRRRTVIR